MPDLCLSSSISTTTTNSNNNPEYVAVILAASIGSRLFPLTAKAGSTISRDDDDNGGGNYNNNDNGGGDDHRNDDGENVDEKATTEDVVTKYTPKHMLPIGGIPQIYRLINTIEYNGFEKCVVIVSDDDDVTVPFLMSETCNFEKLSSSTSSPTNNSNNNNNVTILKKKISSSSSSKGGKNNKSSLFSSSSLEILIVAVNTEKDCLGSADAIRSLHNVTSIPKSCHLVVMPGDLIILEPNVLTKLVDKHRSANSITTSSSYSTNSSYGYYEGGGGNTSTPSKQQHSAITMLLSDVGEQDENGIPLKESSKQKLGGLGRDDEDIEYIGISFENPNTTSSSSSSSSSTSSPRVIWKEPKLDVEDEENFIGKTPKVIFPKARLHGGTSNNNVVTRIRTDWSDLHTYVLSPWVWNQLLVVRPNIVSIQDDVVPLLVTRQFRGLVSTLCGKDKNAFLKKEENKDLFRDILSQPPFDCTTKGDYDDEKNNNNNNHSQGGITYQPSSSEIDLQKMAEEETNGSNSNNDNNGNKRTSSGGGANSNDNSVNFNILLQEYSVLAQILKSSPSSSSSSAGGSQQHHMAVRSSSISSYLFSCRELVSRAIEHSTTATGAKSYNPCLELPYKSQKQSKSSSIIMHESSLGEKCSCKSVTIGTKVKLGNKCRLNNVIIMDNVKIGNNVILQNTIIGNDVVIGDNCNLNDCQVASYKHISSNTKEKGESFF